jgi:hypothetical protein
MAHAAKRLAFPALADERLMRLVKFPAIRKAISGALERAVPEKVATHGTGRYVRFRLADPRSFHPSLFATVPVGSRGTLLVIGTPRAHIKKRAALESYLRRFGRTENRRSLVYQLRRAGIIGGSRTQAVLVPRHRVLSAAAAYSRSSAGRVAANPILATLGFNPGRKNRTRRNGPSFQVSGQYVARVLSKFRLDRAALARMKQRWDGISITGGPADAHNLIVEDYRKQGGGKVGRNPGTVEIKVPFRDGQRISVARMRQWLASLPENAITRLIRLRFEKAMSQYARFHDPEGKSATPTHFTYRAIPMGSQGKRVTDVDVVVSEGKEWAAPYQVPRSSRKYEARTQGRYIHAHGDSKMDIDIRKAANAKKLPERFHTSDGRFVGVVPTRNVKITDWYRG